MKKIAIIVMALSLVGCSQIEPNQNYADKTVEELDLNTVCLNGVEYWYRPGTNAVLAPKLYVSNRDSVTPLAEKC